MHWVVLSGEPERARRGPGQRRRVPRGVAEHARIVIETFRDGFFPYEGAAVKECFEQLKARGRART